MTDREKNKKTAAAPGRNPLVRNNRNRFDTKRGAYTMTDILIVIMLMALIAATAGPRFTKACAERRLPAMVSGLHRMRSGIQIYAVEHEGLLPGQETVGDDISCQAFAKALTEPGSSRRAPYLKEIPANPFVAGDAADDITIVNSACAEPCGDEGTGWWFNVATGEFRANDCGFHSVY